MRGRRRKSAGQSLSLPFEEGEVTPLPPPPGDAPLLPTALQLTESGLKDESLASASAWSQLPLWERPSLPIGKVQLETKPGETGTSEDAKRDASSPSSTPFEFLKPPSEPDIHLEESGLFRPEPQSRPSTQRGKKEPPPRKTSKTAGLEEVGIEAAAEALGLDLDELKVTALQEEFRPFWRFLRLRASARVQQLRAAKPDDPFEWESPSMATVPAFVEDRAAVEALYGALRGEEHWLI